MSPIALTPAALSVPVTRTATPNASGEGPTRPQIRQAEGALDSSGHPATARLGALLGRLDAAQGEAGDTPSAAAPSNETAKVVRPNLDALARVLAHSAAQSAAADTVVSLVKS